MRAAVGESPRLFYFTIKITFYFFKLSYLVGFFLIDEGTPVLNGVAIRRVSHIITSFPSAEDRISAQSKSHALSGSRCV